MGDAAGGKTKKSKKHSEDSASHEAVATSSALIASPAPVSSNTPHILVQGGDSNEGKEKTRRPSKNTLTVSGSRPDEKIKDKSKDKQARKLAKEPSHSSQTTPAPHTTESPILHESEVYKWAGRLKGYKKRMMKLRKNGELEYYHGRKLQGSFSMMGSAVILDRKHQTRFEIDTGRGIWHLRTMTPADREVWVKNIMTIGAPTKTEHSEVAALEARLETLHKNIALAKSLEQVLGSRVEVLKGEPKASSNLEGSTETNSAVLLEDSSEHHKKKKKGHARTKSEDVHAGPTFLQQCQEIQRTVAQLIGSVESITGEIADTVYRLDHALKLDTGSTHASTSSKNGKSEEDSGKDVTPPAEPMIFYNEEASGSDSEDYFDADMDSTERPEDDESSSSNDYFDTPVDARASHTSKAVADLKASSGSPSLITSSAPSNLTSSTTSVTAAADRTASPSGTGKSAPKKVKSKSKSRRLSRTSFEDSRSATRIQLKASSVTVGETFGVIPAGWSPREALPFDKPKGVSIPIMKILKDAIGKDISRITIPVSFSEPINMLQRLVEDFEYGEILLMAAEEPDVRKRLLLVSAFAASSYASIYVRRTKPFNPLLGETFEYIDREKNFRLMTEQVSHHPPIAAFTVDSQGYSLWGHAHAKTKFWGKSLEINPTGQIAMKLHKFDEVYSWNKITTCMNNIIVGNKWIDNYGELCVMNTTTGHRCLMDFKKQGWFGAHAYEIVGTAHDPDDTTFAKVEGLWNDYFASTLFGSDGEPIPSTRTELWKRTPLPENSDKQYYFTSFTMRLNELAEWMKPCLPPTDSRLRPDQRALEDSQTDFSQSEKSRLEDKQRAARKKLEDAGTTYQPTWFHRGEGDTWVYKGGYWEARHAKQWPANLPDIF